MWIRVSDWVISRVLSRSGHAVIRCGWCRRRRVAARRANAARPTTRSPSSPGSPLPCRALGAPALQAGLQPRQLVPVADLLAQLAHCRRCHPRLGQPPHPQQIGDQRGVGDVVFHSPISSTWHHLSDAPIGCSCSRRAAVTGWLNSDIATRASERTSIDACRAAPLSLVRTLLPGDVLGHVRRSRRLEVLEHGTGKAGSLCRLEDVEVAAPERERCCALDRCCQLVCCVRVDDCVVVAGHEQCGAADVDRLFRRGERREPEQASRWCLVGARAGWVEEISPGERVGAGEYSHGAGRSAHRDRHWRCSGAFGVEVCGDDLEESSEFLGGTLFGCDVADDVGEGGDAGVGGGQRECDATAERE